MRVGLIIYDSIHTLTGGYIYDYKLVEYLRRQGVVIKIFSQKKRHIFGLFCNNFSKKIVKEIIDFSPDILLQDEMNFTSLLILNKKLKKRGNYPIISIVHLLQANALKMIWKKWVTKKLERLYLKSIDGFIFNSIATEKSITQILGENLPFLVAYPGKDRLQLQVKENHIKLKRHNSKFRIIFIGNLLYNKGLHVLLHALAQIDYNCWQLSIVGGHHFDGSYTKKILKMISRFKQEDNVTIHGVLDIENLKKELLIQDVLIVPSYYESYGIVYTEAMGAGVPVIASNTGGVPEVVHNMTNGFLIPPGNSKILKECILKLINNRTLLEDMSLSSLYAYKNFPSWDETMNKIHLFLMDVFKKTHP